MQTIINVSVPGPDAEEIKAKIKEQAARRSMSVSRFILWCWQQAQHVKL